MQRKKALIANEWVDAPETITVRSPFTGDPVGEVAKAGPDEMERAVKAAVRAFEVTRRLSAARRSEILQKTVAGLVKRKEELARTITQESAKVIRLSRAEVDRAVATFTIASEEAKRIGGEVLPLDLNAASEGRFFPPTVLEDVKQIGRASCRERV
jgi:glyceraldehyde-3-phosphate dehydrogenase (NADP+)